MTEQPWYWQRQTFFEGADTQARQALLARASEQVFYPQQMIFRADDPPSRIYLVKKGLIKVFNLAPTGEMVTLWFCGEQEPFGSGGIAGVGEQSVFAQSVSETVVWSIAREDFEAVLAQYPQLALNTIRLVSCRLRLACDALVDNISISPDKRLAKLLLRLACQCAQRTDAGLLFDLKLTHQELAQMIGSSRQSVNKALSVYQQRGMTDSQNQRLLIKQPEQLWQFASECKPCYGIKRQLRAMRVGWQLSARLGWLAPCWRAQPAAQLTAQYWRERKLAFACASLHVAECGLSIASGELKKPVR